MYYHRIYSEYSAIEEILLFPEEYPISHAALCQYTENCINITKEQLLALESDPESVIVNFHLSNPKSSNFIAHPGFFKEIYSDNSLIKDFPRDIFILSLNDQQINEIHESFGVLIINSLKPEFPKFLASFSGKKIISKGDLKITTLSTGSKLRGWECVLHELKIEIGPVNAIVIFDNFLFEQNFATDNILQLLNAILPLDLKVDLHFLIVTSNGKTSATSKSIEWFNAKCAALQTEISKLRNYTIKLGIIIHTSEDFHLRALISNYHCFESQYGFCEFNNDIAWKDNNIVAHGGYSGINLPNSDIELKEIYKLLHRAKEHKKTNLGLKFETQAVIGFVENRLINDC